MKIKGNLDITKDLSFSSGPKYITHQSIDPIASGYSAPVGSILINPTNGYEYRKYGTNNTEWEFRGEARSTGFFSITVPTISYSGGNLTVNWGTPRPYLYNGKLLKTPTSVDIPLTNQKYIVWIDGSGVVQASGITGTYVPGSAILSNLTFAEIEISGDALVYQRKFAITIQPDLETINNAHRFGYKSYRGLTGITADGDGTSDTHYSFNFDSGSTYWGRYQLSAAAHPTFPLYRKNIINTNTYTLISSTATDAINFNTTPRYGFSEALVTSGKYFWGHVFSAPLDYITSTSGYGVTALEQYDSIEDALYGLEWEWNNLKTYPRFRTGIQCGAILYQYDSAFTNTKQCRVVSIGGDSYINFTKYGGTSQQFPNLNYLIDIVSSGTTEIITDSIKYLNAGGISFKTEADAEVGTAIGDTLTYTKIQSGVRFTNAGMEVSDVVELTASLSMNATHNYNYVTLDGSSNPVTLTLPISPVDEMVLKVKAIDVSNLVKVETTSHTIDGVSEYEFTQNNETITLVFKTNRWLVF